MDELGKFEITGDSSDGVNTLRDFWGVTINTEETSQNCIPVMDLE